MNEAHAPKAPLLEISELRVSYEAAKGRILAVDNVSIALPEGATLGIVGESGCGKSSLARALLGLVPRDSGEILLRGKNFQPGRAEGLDVQMVFQSPHASLDPAMNIGAILAEAVRARVRVGRKELAGTCAALLEKVGLYAEDALRYPHQFSGGQQQRIAIARALAAKPSLLVADEAVSALDVSVQAQILNLLRRLRREEGLAMLFISHDLNVVRHISDRIAVMYLGRIVEEGPADEIMERPLHQYTKALISASPLPNPVAQRARRRILLRGEPPSPANPPPGCHFAWRSPLSCPAEIAALPGLYAEARPGHYVEIHPGTVDDEHLLAMWKRNREKSLLWAKRSSFDGTIPKQQE